MDRPQLRLVPQSSNGPRIVLLHPTGVPPQPSLIPRVVAQNGPRLPAPQTIPSNVPPRLDSQTPPKHLKHVDVSALNKKRKQKAKPDKSKKTKKKKVIKPNPKQLKYISPDDMKTMVNNKLKKVPRKRAPLLLSSAIKALTVSLLKDAAEKAIEDGSNHVTVDHLKDAPFVVAECI